MSMMFRMVIVQMTTFRILNVIVSISIVSIVVMYIIYRFVLKIFSKCDDFKKLFLSLVLSIVLM